MCIDRLSCTDVHLCLCVGFGLVRIWLTEGIEWEREGRGRRVQESELQWFGSFRLLTRFSLA